MPIKIGSLIQERRQGKATLTVEEQDTVREEEIRISFLKPTPELYDAVTSMERAAESDEATQKDLLVAQLLRMDVQSPDVTEEDGTVHHITEKDLRALDVLQLRQLMQGVRDHFFLQTPQPPSATITKSASAPPAN